MASSSDSDEVYKCSICLELFQKPTRIPCNHVFCEECLNPYITVASPSCPLCRITFNPKKRCRAKDVEKQMSSKKDCCVGCKKKMALSKLRQHTQSCSQVDSSQPKSEFKPAGPTSQKPPSNIPNRSTFQCPICGARNLDCDGLRRHCNTEHKMFAAPVVCPVCASMPWGDPNYKSSNFLHHLNLRHRFEYDTFVDYHQEEDEILKQVMAASMEDV
ncbi:E3 ubiquitin-protein ligase RNF166-like [Diadema antillarum]|uniref:E3 ubiquitin-protein ligase RNF166-like n=1 Tax=Diadema antillarum TaxID=105358 RepID=UPI003A83EF41